VIGTLNRRAKLMRKAHTADGGGGFVESWESCATVWASLEALGGSEADACDAPGTKARYRIVIRRTDVAAGQRVAIGSRRFDIVAVADEGPQAPTVALTCEEIP
jgi:SPP1 family predicted phage head-tail adaptor